MKELAWLEESLGYLITLSAVLIAAAIIGYLLLSRKKKVGSESEKVPAIETTPLEVSPTLSARTVLSEDVNKARRELRILDVERNIYSYAIRHLYEAYAEGRITEEERDRLVAGYKERMIRINEAISRNQSIIALHELERMKEDLFKLFNERFDDIERRIKEIRSRLGIEVIEETPLPPVEIPEVKVELEPKEEKKTVKRRVRKPRSQPSPPEPERSEAEERIERIREEVEKVLEKLGQIEV